MNMLNELIKVNILFNYKFRVKLRIRKYNLLGILKILKYLILFND